VLKNLPVDNSISERALDQFRMNIETFVDVARNAGAVPILALEARLADAANTPDQIARMRLAYTRFSHQGVLRAYQAADGVYRRVAADKNVLLIEGTLQMTGHNEWLVDQVHVSRSGGEKLAGIIADAIEPVLRQRR